MCFLEMRVGLVGTRGFMPYNVFAAMRLRRATTEVLRVVLRVVLLVGVRVGVPLLFLTISRLRSAVSNSASFKPVARFAVALFLWLTPVELLK